MGSAEADLGRHPIRTGQLSFAGSSVQMGAAYEDNFGFWDLDEPEELAFFRHVQRQSVRAVCNRCERTVHLMQPKIICAPCASALECGAPISISDYTRAGPERDGFRIGG